MATELLDNATSVGTQVSLIVGIGPTDIQLQVDQPASLALRQGGGQFRVIIIDPVSGNKELALVMGGADTSIWSVLRGIEGTTPKAFPAYSIVKHILTAESIKAATAIRGVVTALNLNDFTGANPDQASYSDLAADAAIQEIIDTRIMDEDASGGFRRCTKSLYIPHGRWKFSEDSILMKLISDPVGNGTFGFRIFGDGDASRLVFNPSSRGALLRNTNQFLNPVVEKLHLVGGGANAMICESFSGGVAQGWTWKDIIIWGVWADGFRKGALSHGTATITLSNPAVVTLNNHGFAAGQGISFVTTGSLPGLTQGQSYFVLSVGLAANAFQIAAVPGGTPIDTSASSQSGTHTVYTANGNDTWRIENLRGENVTIDDTGGALYHEGVTPGVVGQDQSLANMIINPNIFMLGDQVRLDGSGDMQIIGGSMIAKNASGGNYACIRMPPRAVQPQLGSAKFDCYFTRFELHDLTAKIIDCHWPFGSVNFQSVSSDGFIGLVPSQIAATFGTGDQRGAKVVWRDCTLTGQHEYQSDDNDFLGGAPKALYENCSIYSHLWLQDFVVLTIGGTGQLGAAWQIDFKDCNPGMNYNINATARAGTVSPFWHRRLGADINPCWASIVTAYGGLPSNAGGGSATAFRALARNAQILRVIFKSPLISGASVVTGWSYTVTTRSGIVLAQFGPPLTNTLPWNAGWYESFDGEGVELNDINLGAVTITAANPAVFTRTAHGLVAGDIVWLTTTGALPGPLAVTTPYYVMSAGLTANTFQLGTTPFSQPINTSGSSQSGVHTLMLSNDTLTITSNVINETHKESKCLVEYLPGW